MRRRWVWLAGAAVLFALTVPAVRWWAAEYVYAPRLASDDPRTVVTAYFEAKRWGLDRTAEHAHSNELRAYLDAPNVVTPRISSVFLAGDLVIEGPHDIPVWDRYDQEVQFTVAYRSRWRSTTGERPGPRFWFVYLGRDEGEPWRVLGQGTGP